MATGINIGLRDVPPNIDYSLFCGNRTLSKYNFDHPFNIRDAIYATNGHVIVTHPGEWSGETIGNVPDISVLPWKQFETSSWKRLREQYEEKDFDDGYTRTLIGTGTFDSDYIERVRTLGDIEYRLIEMPSYVWGKLDGQVDSMLFRGSHGIKGILMGMK